MAKEADDKLSKIVSLAKRRGFVFQSSEIYGGLSGMWDYGPLGAELVHNIKDLWWKHFVYEEENMYPLQTTTIMPEAVWKASGHLEGFADPMVSCEKCKRRFRKDQVGEMCPECGGAFGEEKLFNLLFPLSMGSTEGGGDKAYLRGEVAQGMFVNFKNVLDTMRPTLPFGIAQIGKAYRNEIAPRDFLFRVREFDLMEFEYFVKEEEWKEYFTKWKDRMWEWIDRVGIARESVHELEVGENDRAHYSKRTVDFEFDYPFGRKELYGLAYRTDYDLQKHMAASGVDLHYTDPVSGEKFVPHVIEPTFGLGRTLLAVLLSAYEEDELGGEKRLVLKLKPALAPVKAAIFPLLRNKPELWSKAREVFVQIKKEIPQVVWDDNGNIGKRYRRQDEIGTPSCVTIDFQTLEEDTVTVRNRDTGEQERVKVGDLVAHLKKSLS
ncbi:MAG: glycine--tRNA ligase [Parcubacteria group bacterium]|nr:glycine--tRNA ligase [Parcubacteria group bacterium]